MAICRKHKTFEVFLLIVVQAQFSLRQKWEGNNIKSLKIIS